MLETEKDNGLNIVAKPFHPAAGAGTFTFICDLQINHKLRSHRQRLADTGGEGCVEEHGTNGKTLQDFSVFCSHPPVMPAQETKDEASRQSRGP